MWPLPLITKPWPSSQTTPCLANPQSSQVSDSTVHGTIFSFSAHFFFSFFFFFTERFSNKLECYAKNFFVCSMDAGIIQMYVGF